VLWGFGVCVLVFFLLGGGFVVGVRGVVSGGMIWVVFWWGAGGGGGEGGVVLFGVGVWVVFGSEGVCGSGYWGFRYPLVLPAVVGHQWLGNSKI